MHIYKVNIPKQYLIAKTVKIFSSKFGNHWSRQVPWQQHQASHIGW